jgi:ADP-ribosylglycohydrolase
MLAVKIESGKYGQSIGLLLKLGDGFQSRFERTWQPGATTFLESNSYEDAVRNAISLGGDADTMACIAGGIAEAFYRGVPEHIRVQTLSLLDQRLRSVVEEFAERFMSH